MQIGTTLPEAAKALRTMAELACNSGKWDVFQEIALQVLEQVFEHGKSSKD